MRATETLRGELSSFREVGKHGWGVGEVRTADAGGTMPIVGKVLGAVPGDSVLLKGRWDEHPRYGHQFKVFSCEVTVPQDASGIVGWLCTRLPDVGRARAEAIVQAVGAEHVWHVIEREPERLLSVSGITKKRLRGIVEAYAAHREERDQVVQLKGWGLSDHQISVLRSVWGDDIGPRLKKDPYGTIRHIPGFGWKKADALARRMGIEHDAISRIGAAATYVLQKAAEAGHCWVGPKSMVRQVGRVAELGDKLARVAQALDEHPPDGLVRIGGRWCLEHLDAAEQRAADAMRRLLEAA